MADGDARSKVRLRILRQDALDKPATKRWESFEVERAPGMTVHDCLEAIRRHPVDVKGAAVSPVAWEASCLEETCGSCTMTIQGRARQACSALVEEIGPKGQVITVEPLTKFPLERDLIVDRARIFDGLIRVKAWVRIDGGAQEPRAEAQDAQRERYEMSPCIACGACLEACPEYHDRSAFVGAAAINQVAMLNRHTGGALDRRTRIEALMGDGGVADCGKAQNCVEVCPKQIPLVDSIGEMARATTKHMFFGWLSK
ncbi:MAG: succinate dehydrogenase iron-sulfur subunit [Polyangiaceae bacterium]|nr:succinate dehydrogenase iron-sulfur subunit [Polyangiaceae bacterium]